MPLKLKPGVENQLYATIEYDGSFGCIGNHENWIDFIPSGGTFIMQFFENGLPFQEKTEDGYIKYFSDGSILEESKIDKDGNKYIINYCKRGVNNPYGSKHKYGLKTTFIRDEKIQKCYDGEIECENFSINNDWGEYYCECN